MSPRPGPALPEEAACWSELRRTAQARADVLGLPQRSSEDWRYVLVEPLARETAPGAAVTPVTIDSPDAHDHLPEAVVVLVVDGILQVPGRPLPLPQGLIVEDLLRAAPAKAQATASRWASCIADSTDVGVCWSLADLRGAIRIAFNGDCRTPVHLILVQTGVRIGQRIVIDVAAASQGRLLVSHISLGSGRASCALEINLGPGGTLGFDQFQYAREDAVSGIDLITVWPWLAQDSHLTWTSVLAGGDLCRLRAKVQLQAPGAILDLCGLCMVDGSRQAHLHLTVLHQAPRTTSHLLVKGVAGGQGLTSIDAMVRIAQGADGSVATQRNNNLLLSPRARTCPRPQLDIAADDVVASHGASVGEPDADEILYLRSRGLDPAQALAVMIGGFSAEVLHRLTNPGAESMARNRFSLPRSSGSRS